MSVVSRMAHLAGTFWWRRRALREDARRITVAIPTYNRAGLVVELVRRLASDRRIGEIVVRDDASEPDDYAQLVEALDGRGPRIRLARNARNLGVLGNKLAVLADARLPWALLLDSDNEVDPAFLDVFYALPAWSPRVIYCPEQARPNFDFSEWAGAPLDLAAVTELIRGPTADIGPTFLNTANYLLPVAPFLAALQPFARFPAVGADAILASVVWLQQGGLLFAVPGASYHHRVHAGSYFRSMAAPSKLIVRRIASCLASGSGEDLSHLLAEFRASVADDLNVDTGGCRI